MKSKGSDTETKNEKFGLLKENCTRSLGIRAASEDWRQGEAQLGNIGCKAMEQLQ